MSNDIGKLDKNLNKDNNDSKWVLEMENISKKYGGNQVLKDIFIKLSPGEIHALMGENGAGKSTLMNILFGMPVIHSTGGFEGVIKINGEKVNINSPMDAMKYGIGMVHQEFMLIPGFTIAENIKIGREITFPNISSFILGKSFETLDTVKMNEESRTALDTIGIDIDEKTLVKGLPVGYMQFIEIAREIDKKNMKIMVFDEPTAVLTESEASKLLEAMRIIADKGIAIIFITHRLDEVMEVTDSVTVLKDGEYVIGCKTKDTNAVEIAEFMIGRKVNSLIGEIEDERQLDVNDYILSLKNFYVDMPGEKVKGIDIDVINGEIFGIGGLAGQGKLGIPNGIMGQYLSSGEVFFEKKAFDPNLLGESLRQGLSFVSEDRKQVGLLLDESISHNIAFKSLQIQGKYLKKIGPFKFTDKKKMDDHANDMIKLFDIRCTGTDQNVASLSGGNQQKICLANAITLNPKLLLVSEPTRGIDVGAKKLVLEYLSKLNREQGLTIIIVSSELVELRSICDRIAVITDGEISAILKPDDQDVNFGLAMSGKKIKGGVA